MRVNVKSHQTDRALQKFPLRIRKCYFDGEKKLKFFKTYTKDLCEWECLANATVKKCGCAKFSHPRHGSTPVCDFQKLSCAGSLFSANCDCYPPCVDIEYSYKLLQAPFSFATNMEG
jgi:acid-sensing ion channel, other